MKPICTAHLLTALLMMSVASGNVAALNLNLAYVDATYNLGYGGEGAAWDGHNIWVTSPLNSLIIKYSTASNTLTQIDSIPLNNGAWGLAWDGSYLWSGSSGGTYYQHDPSNGTLISSVSVPGASGPGGLTYDGQYLWNAARPDFIQFNPTSGAVVDSIDEFDLSGIEEGLAYDGTYLYAISYTDSTDPIISKIKPVGHTLLESFALPDGLYNGLTFDGNSLWAVGWDTQTLLKISQVPIPAALWLFGSGLLGLIGVARKKAA